jgi:hypothetical protein
MFPYGETVIRQRGAVVTDPYSGEATGVDWDDPDEHEVPGCAFNPGRSSEPLQDARNAVTSQPEVYAPAGVDIVAGDRLVVRGLTFEVDGDPADWISPFTGWAPGLVVALKRTEG